MKVHLTVSAHGLQIPENYKEEEKNEMELEQEEDSCSPPCHPYATVSQLVEHGRSKKEIPLGKSEVLKWTLDPDFTKPFLLDFVLGKPMHVVVTIWDFSRKDDDDDDQAKLGSAIFEISTVLRTKGGTLGKQIKSSGVIMVHVERCSGLGTLNMKLRGLDLVSSQDEVDPYFEIQKKRRATSGKRVWDVVFRSMPIENTTSPEWSEVSMDLGILIDGKASKKERMQKFRISVKDYDYNDDTLIGSCLVTLDDLLQTAAEGNNISLMRPRPLRETGKLLVESASITDMVEATSDNSEEEINFSTRAFSETLDADEEEDIVFEPTSPEGDIEISLDEFVPRNDVNFLDYVSGGCHLRVIVAIDYTASNGDPRKESSLHHFKTGGNLNEYEQSIKEICSLLSEYDSDQKYPVYGFGAKKEGKVTQCFPVGETAEVEGVEGILEAYKHAFKTGIAMSNPTNITEVIKVAGDDAQVSLDIALEDGGQTYTILAIFTNGNVHSVEETIDAINEVKEKPLSIVVVGVGPSDFNNMSFIADLEKEGCRIHFVDKKQHSDESLTEESLQQIPTQLETYFLSKGIQPNPPVETDEIVIEPFSEEGQTGAIAVATEDIPNKGEEEASSGIIPEPIKKVGGKGKKMIFGQFKRQFGRVTRQMERKINRTIDTQVNNIFGIKNATGGAKKNNRRKKMR